MAKLNPSPEEAKDWCGAIFTPMDANYVGECLFFRAVAASLDVDDCRRSEGEGGV